MDPASLNRLSEQTRSLIETSHSPLLRLHYWLIFLEQYVVSSAESPVYLEDALPEILILLRQDDLGLYDPLLIDRLRRLSLHERVLRFDRARAFSMLMDELPRRTVYEPATVGAGGELQATVLLVVRGSPLNGSRPCVSVPATLQVLASRGLRKAGSVYWHTSQAAADPVQNTAERALKAALKSLGVENALLSYEVRLDPSPWVLRGDSLGVALALLFRGFEAAERGVPTHVPNARVTLLGSVDADGAVQPVAGDSLAAKIRTAIGCGQRVIVVPEANRREALLELAAVRKSLPDMPVPDLRSVSTFDGLLRDEESCAVSTGSIKRRIRRPRVSRLWPLAILGVSLLVALIWWRPWPSSPDTLTIIRPAGDLQTVVVRQNSFPPRERNWSFGSPVDPVVLTKLQPLTDCALLVGTESVGSSPARLYCIDVRTRRLLWTRDFSHPPYLSKEALAKMSWHVKEILVTDLGDGGGLDIVVTVLANPMSPCLVYRLDARGETRSLYAHRGYLFRPVAVDLGLDGRKEVILIGTSNSDEARHSQRASLVVLDKDHFSGWPADGAFAGSQHAASDSSLAHVIFPAIPEYCDLFGVPGFHILEVLPRPSNDGASMTVRVGWTSHPGFVVTLDKDFRPVQVVAEDELKAVVQQALSSGTLRTDFTGEERLAGYAGRIFRVP